MKKIRYIHLIVTFFSTVCLCSCNDMENAPTNKFTDNNYWTSQEKAQRIVNMGYNQMYSAGTMWADECLSDNLMEGRGNTDQRMIRNGLATPALGLFANQWKDLYGGIKTCHIFLEKVHLVNNMSEQVRARMIAEIRFIRAYLYFRLTNEYGDVPFFTQDISLEEAKTINRTNREIVIDFIHKELNEIINQLPSRDQLAKSERGKITKGAVCALQARIYLYDNNWEKVIEYCSHLMDNTSGYGTYALFPSYPGLFLQENEYNEEVILDCGYAPSVRLWGEMYDMAPLSAGARLNARAPLQSLVDSYLTINGKSIHEDSEYDENNPYENRDPRLTSTIVYDGYRWSENVADGSVGKVIQIKPGSKIPDDVYSGPNSNQSPTGYYVRKYFDPKHESSLNSSLNIIMMRYADILLMYAEANLELNRMNAEIWNKTIRPIRERAGFTANTALDFPANKSSEEMRQIIRNERRCELALEGLRWFDIKRWKAGSEYLNGYIYGAKFANSNSEHIRLDNRRFLETRDYLWSVPQSQSDLNENLRPNNPGYAN